MKTDTIISVDCNNCSASRKVHYAGQYQYRRVFDCLCGQRLVVSRYSGGEIIISGGKERRENENYRLP
jgi:hypothetical protein